mmetsp:Transcript_15562/g.54324  ORF Transcript_15562/g.54324 Transcript_15562/m.54324 type:complete len:216 (+) Transcript_15562:514-1161(+)
MRPRCCGARRYACRRRLARRRTPRSVKRSRRTNAEAQRPAPRSSRGSRASSCANCGARREPSASRRRRWPRTRGAPRRMSLWVRATRPRRGTASPRPPSPPHAGTTATRTLRPPRRATPPWRWRRCRSAGGRTTPRATLWRTPSSSLPRTPRSGTPSPSSRPSSVTLTASRSSTEERRPPASTSAPRRHSSPPTTATTTTETAPPLGWDSRRTSD